MPSRKGYVPVPASRPEHPAGATPLPEFAGDEERMRVTVLLRTRTSPRDRQDAARQLATQFPRERRYRTLEEYSADHGAAPEDVARVAAFASAHNLTIVEASAARAAVTLEGTAGAFARAFRVRFRRYRHGAETYRSHDEAVQIPAGLEGVITGVVGLDNRRLARRHAYAAPRRTFQACEPATVRAGYDFPTDATGQGECIALIELGGGFHPDDIERFCRNHGLQAPSIAVVEIPDTAGEGTNAPAAPADLQAYIDAYLEGGVSGLGGEIVDRIRWTIEVTMDLELAAFFAPGARLVVYFAAPTARGKFEAFTRALTDADHQPTVISSSWGTPEARLSGSAGRRYARELDARLAGSIERGVTICFSSGDLGDVEFPASSPHVLACGGTHLDGAGETAWSETIVVENVSFGLATGGGASSIFRRPPWQAGVEVRSATGRDGRGVPDVAAKADIATGYPLFVGGRLLPMGGTSAAAPLWAALIARINEKLGAPAGYLNALLYREEFHAAIRDITEGSSGRFRAGPGWDPCTGLGSPIGTALFRALLGHS
jgi:kumamolisin